MTKNLVGIDISDTSIEAVILGKSNRGLVVSAYSRFRLSPDIVDNGRILDLVRLKDALGKLLANAKPKPISAKKVFLSIPESQTYTRIFSVPKNLKNKEMMGFVASKAAEIIPEDPENLLTYVKILGNRGNFREVFFMAVRQDSVTTLTKVFAELGLEVEGVCSEAVSSFAGLGNQFKNKVTLMLDIGARTTIATVFNTLGLRDTVNINIAGDHISQAIASTLNITLPEAESNKESFSFAAPDNQIGQIIISQLDLLASEISRFSAYYQEKYNEKIEQVILIGGSAQLKDIGQYFSNKFLLPVVIGQSLLADNSFPEPLAITKYINAVGLASFAYGNPEINFLAKKIKKPGVPIGPRLKRRVLKILLLIILPLLIAGGVAFYFFKDSILERFSTNNYNASQEIRVSLLEDPATPGLLMAKPYILELETEGVAPGLSYESALEYLKNDLAAKTIAELNKKYTVEGSYIIPQLVEASLVSSEPAADVWVEGQSLKIMVKFTFAVIGRAQVKRLMISTLPISQKELLVDWNIKSLDFNIISYIPDKRIFNLRAQIDLFRP
ncbi:MAG: hypothetical protein C3F02_00185 [Parcubacteria group bacterium]|nr:MAG: hypothetical protein C3F02_00185 [Parcubacteria group bacterium]